MNHFSWRPCAGEAGHTVKGRSHPFHSNGVTTLLPRPPRRPHKPGSRHEGRAGAAPVCHFCMSPCHIRNGRPGERPTGRSRRPGADRPCHPEEEITPACPGARKTLITPLFLKECSPRLLSTRVTTAAVRPSCASNQMHARSRACRGGRDDTPPRARPRSRAGSSRPGRSGPARAAAQSLLHSRRSRSCSGPQAQPERSGRCGARGIFTRAICGSWRASPPVSCCLLGSSRAGSADARSDQRVCQRLTRC